jgi:NADPH2:quinone reductase
MRAIRVHQYGGPEVLRLEETPALNPGSGQVVVAVKAAGVNPVDVYVRAGTFYKASLPYTPGADAAGVVEAVGPGVKRFSKGQRVYTAGALSGTYAQQALCEEAQVFPLPDQTSFAQGAAVGVPYATAYRALHHRAQARAAETILVHGASGGVGLAAVQLARAFGAKVIATAGTEEGLKLVAKEGAHHVFNHKDAGYLEKIMALTEKRGVDVILEMLANVNLGKDLGLLAPKGRVVVIGSRGAVEIDSRMMMVKDSSILGMSNANVSPAKKVSIHAAILAGLENGTLRPVIAREIPLADAALAHEAVMAAGARGKLVLIP